MRDQGALFELQSLSGRERESLDAFERLLANSERFVAALVEGKRMKDLEKAVFHSSVTVARVDYLIESLQKVRKRVFKGAGVKEVMKEVALGRA